MFSRLFGAGEVHPEYAFIPLFVILVVSVLAYMKKGDYPIGKRILIIAIMVVIYFSLFIGAGFLLGWF